MGSMLVWASSQKFPTTAAKRLFGEKSHVPTHFPTSCFLLFLHCLTDTGVVQKPMATNQISAFIVLPAAVFLKKKKKKKAYH
ncbi:hypothetical protein XELAEV_18000401mg [Xenopus laevis]|uniref:Uncharacterized protein n=1 Tax=Xenopus laevis TaxID=8355 RepID=A0A974BP53_XENLA|nr:hypothetical protein XELAEV_18000401mg [Xenopus laevis]